jgi:hypothetical protein
MFQIIVIENGEPRHKFDCDSYVIGAVDAHADQCITEKAGGLALCSFATLALFAEVIGVLKNHLEPLPLAPGS